MNDTRDVSEKKPRPGLRSDMLGTVHLGPIERFGLPGEGGESWYSNPLIDSYWEASLRYVFDGEPPAEEREMWLRLSPDRRTVAVERLRALRSWMDGKAEFRPLSAERFALALGISKNRFYRMLREATPRLSLSKIGVFADAPPRRVGRTDRNVRQKLSEEARKMAVRQPAATVDAVVVALSKTFSAQGADIPRHGTLRTIVEEAFRDVRTGGSVGRRIALDCTAVEALRHDGLAHVAFLMLDRDSRLIIGGATGSVERSRGAYRKTASNAKDFLATNRLRWSGKEETVITVGSDAGAWRPLADLNARLVEDGPRRFGRYVKEVVGPRLGEIGIRPSWTDRAGVSSPRKKVPIWSDDEAGMALRVSIAKHNDGLLDALRNPNGDPVPEPVARLMDVLIAE